MARIVFGVKLLNMGGEASTWVGCNRVPIAGDSIEEEVPEAAADSWRVHRYSSRLAQWMDPKQATNSRYPPGVSF